MNQGGTKIPFVYFKLIIISNYMLLGFTFAPPALFIGLKRFLF